MHQIHSVTCHQDASRTVDMACLLGRKANGEENQEDQEDQGVQSSRQCLLCLKTGFVFTETMK